MQRGGFGIAGHRNNYSTGVRNGDWVEDTIGGKLAAQVGRAGYGGQESETQRQFRKGKGKYEGESLVAFDAETQQALLGGVSKSLLFYHGTDIIQRGGPAKDFYTTTAQRMNKPTTDQNQHLASDPLAKTRTKYMSDEAEAKVSYRV